MSFVIALSAMHSYVWYRVAGMLTKLSLQEPFSKRIAMTLDEIGIQLLGIWIVSVIAQQSVPGSRRIVELTWANYTLSMNISLLQELFISFRRFLRGVLKSRKKMILTV